MKLVFKESYNIGIEGGYGTGSVVIKNDQQIDAKLPGVTLNWREDNVTPINQIPSPYEDPYGFISEILSVAGIEHEMELVYGEDSEES